ncbi:MAG TPA: hypothetical protein VFU47_16505 [Armatimonadota bacterium]|nr:hypothetical protein [Armatimonadota bacterium]
MSTFQSVSPAETSQAWAAPEGMMRSSQSCRRVTVCRGGSFYM